MGKSLAKSVNNRVEELFDRSPYLKAALQLDPTGIGGGFEVLLSDKISKMKRARFIILLDELEKGDKELTQETIDSEDFLSSFFTVTRIALNASREEKIRRFGRILITATKEKKLQDDTLEEFTNILDGLSVRELQILLILHKLENQYPKKDAENETDNTQIYWDDLKITVYTKLEIEQPMLISILARLEGYGLFNAYVGFIGSNPERIGRTTILFHKFYRWIELKNA